MRILYVINGFDPGGAEHGLLTLIRGGFFQEHDLEVIGLCRGRGNLLQPIERALGAEKVSVARDEDRFSVAGFLYAALAVWKAIRRFKPDLVVLSLKQANLIGRLLLVGYPGIRCVSFEHISHYRAKRFQGLYGVLLYLLSFRVNQVWADCQSTLDSTRRYFVRSIERKGSVVPLFVADEHVVAKSDYSLGETIRVVAAGRLVDRKNFDVILKAVLALRDDGLNVVLDIFGEGPERDNIAALTESLGLIRHVKLHGYCPDWVPEAAKGDIFVNTGDTEGFCIVAAEAMLAGLPVVAVDVGGISEYGADRINMLKIARAETAALISALAELIADEDLRRKLGERARLDMLSAYSGEALRRRGSELLQLS